MKLLKNKWFIFSQAVLTSLVVLFYSSCRPSYYFIDKETFGGATVWMLGLFAIAFFTEILCFFFHEKMAGKALTGLSIAGLIILLAGIGISVAFAVMGWEMWGDYAFFIRKSLPYFLLIWFVITLCIVLSRCGKRALMSVALCAVFTLSVLLAFFRPVPFRMSAQPTVFVTGEEQYNIVWATSTPSIGKLTVMKDDISYAFTDEVGGNPRTDDKVHHITVPAALLNGCDYYSVRSEQVKERTGYSLWKGKTVESEHYTFRTVAEDAETINIWSLSDWHEHPSLARQAAGAFPQADVLIMCGDSMNMVNDQNAVIEYLLKPCGEITASAIPVIYAKGNHECRGDYAVNLQRDLGFESFYFTYKLGALGGVVLDMGECHGDDFPEYFGAADYEAYRDTQESWLKNVTLPQASYQLCVCHDEWFEEGKEGRIKRESIAKALGEKGAQLLVAGHEHESRYLPAGENGRTFHTFVDGGIDGKSFVAGLITIEGTGCTLKTVHSNGETVLEESFSFA